MLWQRILTAVPLAILAIWVVLFKSTDVLFYVLLVITLVCGWEWALLSGIVKPALRAVIAVVLAILVYVSHTLISQDWLQIIFIITAVWWALVIYRMSIKPPASASDQFSLPKLFIALITIIPPVLAMLHVHALGEDGPAWMLFMLSLVWVADIGAYFSGRRFGKVKLAPHLSPGKTREGMYGALVLTGVYSIAAAYYFALDITHTIWLLLVVLVTTLISIAGDLFISLLKRERGLKDTGAILPGHGGVLDRIDSVTSSAPFFALMLDVLIRNV
jgi:phosphatidate cytidylyltransferase